MHYLPVTMATWERYQKYRQTDSDAEYPLLDMGIAGLFFNRTTFSGIMNAGPLGGALQTSQYKLDCRFNKERLIKQIYDISFYNKKVDVHFDDALTFLKAHTRQFQLNCLLSIDPKGGTLY